MPRLCETNTLVNLVQFLGQHLGEQYISQLPQPFKEFSEAEKLAFLPMLFGLMPRSAAIRSSPYFEVKPEIRRHLGTIGISFDELLVDLLKTLCDNFDRTQPSVATNRAYRPRKFGLADLRQRTEIYKRIVRHQNHRCAVCGTLFVANVQETLDHIVPWRLGGDPEGGVNWQLLCKPCNDAKSDHLSSLCMIEYVNWVYSDRKDLAPDLSENRISLRTRYLMLSSTRQCKVCGRGPKDAQLLVFRMISTGFSVFDHLTVQCADHATSEDLLEVTV